MPWRTRGNLIGQKSATRASGSRSCPTTDDRFRRWFGQGTERLRRIKQSWEEQKEVRKIMLFLAEHGISSGRAVRIYRTYGQESIAKIKENPYQLADDTAAYAINQGRMPELKPPEGLVDFYFIEATEPEAIQDLIVRLVKERIPKRFGFDPKADIQVLTPMNRSVLEARNLTQVPQTALNPGDGGLPVLALQGNADERMSAAQAVQLTRQLGERGTYREFEGDHLLLAKRASEVQDALTAWLSQQEKAARVQR